ncbi:MAG: TIGR03013 family XrtA/PEP-CTERM system glycosyltransferase [Candidatus Sulfotelmatobacter sp.]
MIRLFKVYYPMRTLVLLLGEALVVWIAFVVGTLLNLALFSQYGWLRLRNALFIDGGQFGIPGLTRIGGLKLVGLTAGVLLLSHGFDLYDSSQVRVKVDQVWRMLFVIALVAVVIRLLLRIFPGSNLPEVEGLVVLTIALFGWRWAYSRLLEQPLFRERVYVLGAGGRAERLIRGLEERSDLGIDVVGWSGQAEAELSRQAVASHMLSVARSSRVRRVIVAMDDRRGALPVNELLQLRLQGVKVEEATSWLEKIYGRIEVEQLNPSWLIFAEGFHFDWFKRLVRRAVNFAAAVVGLIVSLPLIPFVMLAVKLSSDGPIFYHQKRVGRGGREFYCHKFRTMLKDAEADTGATWASDNDPRITRVGSVLRFFRLDEIPQLWCVLKGEMHFVGPRPERPEFVVSLGKEIPYYDLRHIVRPGITGWAQVQHPYANTVEDSREKLQYDLFYIKNASIGLDLWIMFQTIKIVLLGRGAKVNILRRNDPRLDRQVAKTASAVNAETLGTRA